MHRMRRARVLLVVAVLAVLAAACEAEGEWVATEPAPPPSAPVTAQLRAVSCSTPTSCVAVGFDNAAAFDGTAWRDISGPDLGDLVVVSCGTPTWCIAATGAGDGHLMRWDGASWTPATRPTEVLGDGVGNVVDLDCQGSGCVAVLAGAGAGNVLARFDGTTWSLVDGVLPAGASATVSCWSATGCVVVATTSPDQVTAASWAGTAWAPMAAPASFPDALDCTSASACTSVVRPADTTLFERWNGSSWSTVPVAGTGVGLAPLACSTSACHVAVIDLARFAAGVRSYDGTAFTDEWFDADERYLGLDCAGNTCVAVGYDLSDRRISRVWTGSTWSRTAVPERLVPGGSFGDVACVSDTECVALGSSETYDPQVGVTSISFVQRWDGAGWTTEALPEHRSQGNLDLDCTTDGFCAVVGAKGPSFEPIVLVRRAGTWSSVPITGTSRSPDQVDCVSATFCLGWSTGAQFRWDGTTWTATDEPLTSSFGAMDCLSETYCIAVGGAGAHRWDGSSWTAMAAPQPAGYSHRFDDLDCTGPDRCVAVGMRADTRQRPMAFTWDGTAWYGADLAQGSDVDGHARAVSCAPGVCVVTGYANDASTPVWSAVDAASREWLVVPQPDDAEGAATRYDVACRTGGCLVVGYDVDGSQRPWASRWVPAP